MPSGSWPHAQHWTVDGYRVTVMFYKRDNPRNCRACGAFPARHAVWAEETGPGGGFSGHATHFCDACRPAKGTRPDLDYLRLIQGSGAHRGLVQPIIYERTAPWPGHACAVCGAPAVFRAEHQCGGCDDPARQYATRHHSLTLGGVVASPSEWHHLQHAAGEEYRCAGHAPAVALEAARG